MRSRPLLIWLGLALLPLVALVDTGLAMAGGWKLRSAGALALAPIAALGALLFIAAWWLIRRRRMSTTSPWRWLTLSLATLVGLAAGEVVSQAIAPRPAFHLRAPNAKYEYDPNPDLLLGVGGHAVMTINSRGLRGPELPPRERAYRILCVGGSAVEGYYLDDGEAWTTLLAAGINAQQPGKPVWVGAAAVSELASGDHERFLRGCPLAREMDCWLLLVGVNDFLRLLLGYDQGAAPPVWFASAPAQSLKQIWNQRLRNGFVVDATGDDLSLHRLGFNIPEAREPDLPQALDDYERRLRAIVQAARQAQVRLVLVCQPVLWDEFLTPQGKKRLLFTREMPYPRPWKYLKAGNFRDAIDQYNERLQAVCRDTDTECVASLLELNGREACFYDDFLFSEQGCREVARRLTAHFASSSANSAP